MSRTEKVQPRDSRRRHITSMYLHYYKLHLCHHPHRSSATVASESHHVQARTYNYDSVRIAPLTL